MGRWGGGVRGVGGRRDPGQIGLHESRGISYINTGRAINNTTIRPRAFSIQLVDLYLWNGYKSTQWGFVFFPALLSLWAFFFLRRHSLKATPSLMTRQFIWIYFRPRNARRLNLVLTSDQ